MDTTTRTIEEVLQLRRRTAEIRVVERAAAAVKAQQALEMAIVRTDREQDLVEMRHALDVAREALALARQEIDSQQGLPVEPVLYDPASTQTLNRYAGVLMLDDPELSTEQAFAQAHADERVRLDDYMARYHPDTNDDLDDDPED